MSALTNPFDLLPDNLFNPLSAFGNTNLQRHYMAILLRIYEAAEFNRFGLTRDSVIAEIVDYLTNEAPEAMGQAEEASLLLDEVDFEPNAAFVDNEREYASWFLRRLIAARWVEVEQQTDYTDMIILPDYAFTLLEAFRTIQQQKPREYTGQLYTAHQLIMAKGNDFSPALAISQSYENIRQMIRGLNELNQNIRRYTERITRDKTVPEMLRMQFDEYAQALGPAYHTLKTSDHVSRYRRDIVARLQKWEVSKKWLENSAEELAMQSRLSPAQASTELGRYMSFIIHQLEGLDPLLEEIDRRHAQYLRTSLRQIRYQLVSAEGGFKDRLSSLARQLAELKVEGESEQPEDMPAFLAITVEQPDGNSFYTLPKRRAAFTPGRVISPILNRQDMLALRNSTLQELGQAITPAKIAHFVGQFFNGSNTIHIRDVPPDTFASEADLPWLIYTIAYGNHPEVDYNLEPLSGDPVRLGPVRVHPFQLVKRGK